MAKSSAKLSIPKSRLPVLSVVILFVVAAVGLVGYQVGYVQAQSADAGATFHQLIVAGRVSGLYNATRDFELGGGSKADLDTLYRNFATEQFAAKLEQAGPSYLFCSTKTPVSMNFEDPTLVTQSDGNEQVGLDFSVKPTTEAYDETVRVTYSATTNQITGAICLAKP